MPSDKFTRLVRGLPSFYKAETNTMIRGLLKAWGVSDDEICVQLENTKDQLFVKNADGRNLNRLGSNVGVDRAPELSIGDDDFRQLVPVMSFFPKQVRKTIVALLDVFWGPGFTRPNINSINSGPYNFGPESLAGGTAHFRTDNKIVKGTGTTFLTTVAIGDYIKPVGADGTTYQKVSAILDDETLELSLPWASDIAINSDIQIGVIRELEYETDARNRKVIRFTPNAFSDLTAVTIAELVEFINNNEEHSPFLTASEFIDPILGTKLNLRTNTSGLQGSIEILGGDANTVLRLNFNLEIATETKAKVLEVNANEIVVQIPSSVPILRRSLRGSAHPRETKAIIFSEQEVFNFATLGASSILNIDIDGSPFIINFNHALDFANPAAVTAEEVAAVINSQLLFLKASTSCLVGDIKAISLQTTEGSSEYQVTGGTANIPLGFDTTLQVDPDIIDTINDFPSSYLFDPVGQLFTVTGTSSTLASAVTQGNVQATLTLDDASSFPNTPGKLLLDFGRKEQEGPINYTSRPNNSTLLVDASHIFEQSHAIGRKVNFISDTPTIPRVTGVDYPVFVVGTDEAREAAQDLIRKLLASGVVIRFLIDFPEFLFVCECRGCGPSEDSDLRGSLTGSSPLVF